MVLGGAELLLYPSAIGSEPAAPGYDSRPHWERVMCGHAAANLVPVAASNRVGTESGGGADPVTFHGGSFLCDATGDVVARARLDAAEVALATFDLDALARFRAGWGLFRDRRPELYGALGFLDGEG